MFTVKSNHDVNLQCYESSLSSTYFSGSLQYVIETLFVSNVKNEWVGQTCLASLKLITESFMLNLDFFSFMLDTDRTSFTIERNLGWRLGRI